ncbi:DUF1330 domain-containing protein [Mycolicibacterium sp. GCM10028919]|uniref:DUF1330 domain-containing protein n=1 Tax=Mycolicibacterium sp. GCM10028919 TaxID=3273401 RepID=UPI0036212E11
MTDSVPAYAVAYLRDVDFNEEIIRYMREIDATLAPFGGEFIVHGGRLTAVEGEWDGTLVIIRFPDPDAATRWYESPGYQRILPLRLDNSSSIAALVEGVAPGHSGAKRVAELLGG